MGTVLVERAEGVVTVTLNRPEKKNAVNSVMWEELRACFAEVTARRDDRVMVLTGAGGAFCSGADLTGTDIHGDRLALMRRVADIALALHRIPQPTIAKVHGVAAGAGWNMALACDLVVASEEARFSQIFARRGLSLDFGGSWLLPRLVGLHRAKELALLAETISAKEAVELGLANRMVGVAELDDFVADWARRLAEGPPIALSLSKSLLNQSSEMSLVQALDEEGRCQVLNFATADTAEALAAFLEKRPPHFTGR